MVTVSFDPTIDAQAGEGRRQGRSPPIRFVIPDDPFAPDPNDPKYIADQKAAEEKAEARQGRLREEARRRPEARQGAHDRFGPWYYVTPGESFSSDQPRHLDPHQAQGGDRLAFGRRPRCRPAADSPGMGGCAAGSILSTVRSARGEPGVPAGVS